MMGPGRMHAKNRDHLIADMDHVKWDDVNKRPKDKDIQQLSPLVSFKQENFSCYETDSMRHENQSLCVLPNT